MTAKRYVVAAYVENIAALEAVLNVTERVNVYPLNDDEFQAARIEVIVPNGNVPKKRKPRIRRLPDEPEKANRRRRPKVSVAASDEKPENQRDRVLKLLQRKQLTGVQIKELMPDVKRGQVDTLLWQMRREGSIERDADKRYTKTRLG